MKTIFRKSSPLLLLICSLLFANQLVAQCPSSVHCNLEKVYVFWPRTMSSLPTDLTFEFNGTVFSNQVPIYEGTNLQIFDIPQICSGQQSGNLDIVVSIPSQNNLSCTYVDGLLKSQNGGDPPVCPQEFNCTEHAGLVGLGFDIDDAPLPPLYDVSFYFDNLVCANGKYGLRQIVVQGLKYAVYDIPCKIGEENATVVFGEGTEQTVCVYENGQLCETCPPQINNQDPCQHFLENCGEGLGDLARTMVGENCKQWEGPCLSDGPIFRMGKVGIGFAQEPLWQNAANYNLLVKGDILTEQFKVCKEGGVGWCDYVFEPDYPLRSLADTEQFIKNNKHLPGMPSAADIEEAGGIEMADMSLRQQEKIEELYLHLIALNKQLKKVEAEFTTQ